MTSSLLAPIVRCSALASAALLLALTACGSAGDGSAPEVSASEPETTTGQEVPIDSSAATTATTAVDDPTPARQRLDWVVEQLNDPGLTPDQVATGFNAGFLAQVTPEQLMAAVGQLVGDDTGWQVEDEAGIGKLDGEATLVSEQDRRVGVTITVEAAEPHLIAGLLFTPVAFAPGQAVTFEAIDTQLSQGAEAAAYGLFDVSDGRCRLVHGLEPERVMPLGSAFKLWVLGALAREVEAGRAAWDEELPVDDGLKSSPDGEISALAAGTPMTLERHAELMISISDNSATDHLLARLGRETVEQAMVASGVAEPARNVPMLSTRELFLLKWGAPARAGEYLALGPEDRRAYLDGELAGIPLAAEISADFVPAGPTRIEELEWFASAADSCRIQLWLAELAGRPGLEPVARILQVNPGLAFEPQWTDVRFKGGSEPGVVYASWRLVHQDGSVHVLAGGLSDTTRAIAGEVAAVATLQAAAALVP